MKKIEMIEELISFENVDLDNLQIWAGGFLGSLSTKSVREIYNRF